MTSSSLPAHACLHTVHRRVICAWVQGLAKPPLNFSGKSIGTHGVPRIECELCTRGTDRDLDHLDANLPI